MRYRGLLLSFLSILLISSSVYAYDFELIQSRVVPGASRFIDFDPVVDTSGVLRGILYLDSTNQTVILDMFSNQSRRVVHLDSISSPSPYLRASTCLMWGDTVRAYVVYNHNAEEYPHIAMVDFTPHGEHIDTVLLGLSNEDPWNWYRLEYVRIDRSQYYGDQNVVIVSFEDLVYCEYPWVPGSMSFYDEGSTSLVYNTDFSEQIFAARAGKVTVGDVSYDDTPEFACNSFWEFTNGTSMDPTYVHMIATMATLRDTTGALLWECRINAAANLSIWACDLAPGGEKEELLYYGSFLDLVDEGCGESASLALFRMTGDSLDLIWCRPDLGGPKYFYESKHMLVFGPWYGRYRFVDGGTGETIDSAFTPNPLYKEVLFEAEDDLLHVLGRTEDTVKVFRLDITTDIPDTPPVELPSAFTLSQNYPNPFNPSTTIEYSLPKREYVTLEVFNILGQQVRLLVDADQPAGAYRVSWDGKSESGNPVSTGVYLYRLRAGDYTDTREMLLLK